MILIGQYDSPFVRRVGIALTLYELPFEHRTWSAFSDADKLRQYNPLTRVPTLVLDDGTVLVESHAMLDYLDSRVPVGRRMFPASEPARHRALRIATLATGLGDKAVSIFYEKRLHDQTSALWLERCRTQVAGALGALEREQAAKPSTYWFGEAIGHADIAVGCVLHFVNEVLPGLLPMTDCPALARHCAHLEALPVFQQVRQPFTPPR
ncbi:MAG TPA: glutathione S-transferase family protein [Kiloniellales bacterium]|nr:glutathione S-transferase family protein [Kiloniellales bacterium]